MLAANLRTGTINLVPRDGKTLEDFTNTRISQTHTMRGNAVTASKPGGDVKTAATGKVELVDYVSRCLSKYGLCVLDNFLGERSSDLIAGEVLGLYQDDRSLFHDGQLVHIAKTEEKIRGDKITWVDGTEPGCSSIKGLIALIDRLIVRSKKQLTKDKPIRGRSKAMVACYPGGGKCYKRHVDNSNGDGRCLTVIYYVNKDWDAKSDGGLLRIFPQNCQHVADVEPKLDRLLIFWSDRRNPHEVHPCFRNRFAITLWYFDQCNMFS